MMFRLGLTALLSLALIGCGASAPKNGSAHKTPQEAVAERAKARWDAIVSKELRKAYDMLTPGTRSTMSFEAYGQKILRAQIQWTGAEVKNVVCDEPEVCIATVQIDYSIRVRQMGMQDMKSSQPLVERWLKSGGEWYYLPETPTN